ncbi:hydroxysteroid 17-beta dehydrogenase 11 [Aspergillus campestris IBT 28561]|uniref:Hydroxysteroid 17-beta dehydrogenase 11 n=1 Tax=Aspergillus campestris (strain IBT 28561) TaxID=1392248 RepID=A0A2I1D2T3_ASPC2|nr:hydroxysteroid 17-beta dehydrogenase 11 [Aspergillus campestris IBT 28561]PKY04183.1 hydroxysteroid 17-beta dehydrogenase 11 [Aspergillus campestris IBT 28561]
MTNPPRAFNSYPSSPTTQQRWYKALTIDVLLAVLNRTILHPWVAWILVLSLRAQVTPYTDLSFVIATGYAVFLTLIAVGRSINHRVAYGLPRPVDLTEEVVIVTGGASGLGQVIARMYAMRGASVAVLDIKPREEISDDEMSGGAEYYCCDVGDRAMVEATVDQIEKELGTPTILINCAAASINGLPLLSLPASSFQKTLSTNLFSVLNTTQVCLPRMLSPSSSPSDNEDTEARGGGTIVNISSVTGALCPAGLSDYSASKSALTALHHTLEAEIRASGTNGRIKMLLVETGQIATPLFRAVRTPNAFFAPVLEPVQVARAIVDAVDAGEGGTVRLPFFASLVHWYAVLPAGVQRVARWLSGIDGAVAEAGFEGGLRGV